MNCYLEELEHQVAAAAVPAGAIFQNGGNAKTTLDDTKLRRISNTGSLTSQNAPFVGHIHYLAVAFYIDWGAAWGKLRKLLSENRYRTRFKGVQVIEFGGHKAKLMARAPAMGSDSIRMSFYLVIDGVVFLLSDRRSASGCSPNVVVQVPGQQCLRKPGKQLLKFIRSVINGAGGVIICEKLSRVDLALDLLDVSMDTFWSAYQENRFITRAKHHRQIGGTEGRTVYFGKPPLSLCIYDKAAQLKTLSGQHLMGELYLLRHLWAGWRTRLRGSSTGSTVTP